MTTEVIKTAKVGTNADLFPDIISLYFKKGDRIADVTWGKGVFWKNVNIKDYALTASDISLGVDLRHTPYVSNSLDGFILDPPYAHSSTAPRKNIMEDNYKLNTVVGREEVFSLYYSGIDEARRTLKKNGVLVIKCQDEVMGGKQRWNHIEIMQYALSKGFICEDLFVMVQKANPIMRHKHQVHARKNHSYFLVFKLKCD